MISVRVYLKVRILNENLQVGRSSKVIQLEDRLNTILLHQFKPLSYLTFWVKLSLSLSLSLSVKERERERERERVI